MARTFTAQDLISLPIVNAEEATALATELVTSVDAAGKLPPAVAESAAELREANDVLAGELRKRIRSDTADPGAARAADLVLDRAWSATEKWLAGWVAIEDAERGAIAAPLYARLFPDGLSFVNKSYKAEWAESEARLSAIDEDKLAKSFDALGGKPFLKNLQAAHAVYGKALGITAAKSAPELAPQVRDARDAVLASMREHVAQVAASVRRKKPESEVLATQLLRPLAAWETSRRAVNGGAVVPDAPPVAPAAPAPGTPTPSGA